MEVIGGIDAKYGSVVAPMARAEDLVLYKAFAARPKDIDDATALLLMHGDIDLARVRRRLGELAALADQPTLVAGLEAMIKQATSSGIKQRKPAREKPVQKTPGTTKPRRGGELRTTSSSKEPKPAVRKRRSR